MNKYLIFLFLYFTLFQQNIFAKEIYGNPRIIDGDSIEINNEKIRFLGIDAFEKKQKCYRKDGTKYNCGEKSASILHTIISEQPIRCVTKKKDHYKRWLATCYIGTLDINENMVLLGHALNFMSEKYEDAQKEAEKSNAGAWAGGFMSPEKFRKLKRKELRDIHIGNPLSSINQTKFGEKRR